MRNRSYLSNFHFRRWHEKDYKQQRILRNGKPQRTWNQKRKNQVNLHLTRRSRGIQRAYQLSSADGLICSRRQSNSLNSESSTEWWEASIKNHTWTVQRYIRRFIQIVCRQVLRNTWKFDESTHRPELMGKELDRSQKLGKAVLKHRSWVSLFFGHEWLLRTMKVLHD